MTEPAPKPLQTLMSALLAARKQVAPRVHKAGKNEQQKYTYVGHEHVLVGGARDALLENGLVLLLESYELVGADSYKTQSGDKQCWRWRGRFALMHVSGDRMELVYEATTVPNDKAGFVASTALDRTAHMRVLELAGSDEENPEHDSHDQKERRARKPAGAEARPLASSASPQGSAPASSQHSSNGSSARQTSASARSTAATPSSTPSTDRELPTSVEGWLSAHRAVCDGLFKELGIEYGPADEYGLTTPTLPVPSFSAQAKAHAGAAYNVVPAGYLRSVMWVKPKFWEAPDAAKALWVSYLVARYELQKLEADAAERALSVPADL